MLRPLGLASTLFGLLSLSVACENGSPPEIPPAAPAPTPTGPTCQAPTKGPTIHKGDLAGDEVWPADASPHLIEATVTIRGGRTLTVEPCAEVRIARGASIQVAFPGTPNEGALVAEGTATRPIRFAGRDEAGWSGVMVHAPGTARLAHVTFEGGGGDAQRHGASVLAVGDGVDGADPLVRFDHVTITKSQGTAVWMQRGATFIEGSRDLTVRESGSQAAPYPVEIEEHALGALPTGSYTGNRRDEILVDPRGGQVSGSGILADGTIHDRGVPYHVGTSKQSRLVIGGRPDGKLVTVTVEPGVVMRFEPGSALEVQHFTNEKPSTGALRAMGTAGRPIVFTSAAEVPRAGDWQGLWYGGIPAATNALDQVRIEHAGADCGCILSTCSAITEHEGAIIFTSQPPKAFVTNTKFVDIAGNAITEGFAGQLVDFRPTNEFVGVSGCAQTLPRVSPTSCPSPRPACD